jgi:hypothetical protein
MYFAASVDAVVEVAGQMHGLSSASHRQFLAAVLEVDQRGLWRVDGAHSMEMWLSMRFAMRHATAVETLRVARGFVFSPQIADQYAADHLSWDQVVSCVDLVAFGGLSDAEVAEDAVGRSAAELDRLAREARRVSRTQAQERQQQRYLRMRWQRNGMLRISGALPDAEGKAFETAIRRGAQDQPAASENEVPVFRPLEERQADALTDLASARLARDEDPDLATVVVHCDADTVFSPDSEGLAAIQLGPVIATSTVLRLCCDGRIQLVVDDASGATIKVIRTEHAVPRWMRRTVLNRDGGCRWPGCGRHAFLHIHHLIWWSNGGQTQENNLCGLCTFHHKLVHEGGWTITGDPFGHLTFTAPNGRTLRGGPPGLRRDVVAQFDLAWSGDPPVPAA